MMAGPLHAQVLSDPAIPVGLLGLVHVAQTVTQHRDLPGRAPLDVEVWLEGHRPARQGAELDLHTEVRHAGDLAWDGVTTVLARGPWKDPRASGAPDEDDPIDARGAERWTIPENIGRRWRAVSGDPNPIHLHRLLARPFGFRGAIAHGTWLLARVAARLGEADGAARLECRFRRPVFLPGEVSFCTAPIDDGTRFTLRSPTSGKRHLEGRLIHLG
ncbi:MAG: MaoC/PaaZ C-terminal domain-containing protein [Myxococcota bacterium]